MKRKPYLRKFERLVDIQPCDPALKRLGGWLPANKGFHQDFRDWLKATSFSPSTINTYAVASRYAFGYLDQPYWKIDPDADLQRVWGYLQTRSISLSTLDCYRKGLAKLAEYLRLRCHKPLPPKAIYWAHFTGMLPTWLHEDVRSFIAHCQRNWSHDRQVKNANHLLSPLTIPLRWIAARFPLNDLKNLTPQTWCAYLDARLLEGISPKTLNRELAAIKHLVFHVRDQGREVNERFLLLDYLDVTDDLPRDVPLEQLQALLRVIQAQTASLHASFRRAGRMDLAWFLLMLHSGLRTGEVRFLRLADIDWQGRRIRIEQSKGLKDRMVFLSQATIEALQAYLEVRGPKDALPEQVFIYAHKPLSASYCFERLRTLGKRCGVSITPHRLRHSCATLLLNAGAPVLTVQNILGHKWVDTTLGYARLYDGTVAADYYQAMAVIERQMALPEDRLAPPPPIGQLLALVDSLREGTLNKAQAETVRQLRAGILALSEQQNVIQDVKVLAPTG